jgi:hypothetical protein
LFIQILFLYLINHLNQKSITVMRKISIINSDNVCGIYSNLSRAYEIALLGGFKIRLIKSNNIDDHIPKDIDLDLIKSFFAGVEFTDKESDLDSVILHIEVTMPSFDMIVTTRKSETVNDHFRRANDAQVNELSIFKLSESGRALLKTAYERLNLTLNDLDSIVSTSQVISRLHGSKEIKVEYLAEAIQYHSYGK